MKCINRVLLSGIFFLIIVFGTGCSKTEPSYDQAAEYEKANYDRNMYQGTFFAEDLCVTDTDVPLEGYQSDGSLHASGLFDIKDEKVLCADRIHERLYPASTTKVMTAYLALRYGNLDDVVTVSESATQFAPDEQVCGLNPGDTLTLYDLLCGLPLASGNDCAAAIAEYMAGSMEAFADMMNQEAASLGATNTHFVNAHGLHDENHYTTAYDLYLMFNACVKDQRFIDIISMDSYTAELTDQAGAVRTEVWEPTNYYSLGLSAPPEGIRVFGGKTGTTDQAGSCVILYSQDLENRPYISVIMGAPDKDTLYVDMTALLSAGLTANTKGQ